MFEPLLMLLWLEKKERKLCVVAAVQTFQSHISNIC